MFGVFSFSLNSALCAIPGRSAMGRRAPFCAFCILLAIFRAKLCAKLPLDIFPLLWYNNNVKRGTSCGEINLQVMEIGNLVYNKRTDTKDLGRKVSEIRKIVANIFRKPLDKIYIMWYNIYVRASRKNTLLWVKVKWGVQFPSRPPIRACSPDGRAIDF